MVSNESSSSPTMSAMTIEVSNASSANYGVYNESSSPTMSAMAIKASGGSDSCGVYNYNSSSPSMSAMTIEASLASNSNYGVYNESSSDYAYIRNSHIEGSSNGVYDSGGDDAAETYISDSILIGRVSHDPKCSFVFEPDGTELTGACAGP